MLTENTLVVDVHQYDPSVESSRIVRVAASMGISKTAALAFFWLRSSTDRMWSSKPQIPVRFWSELLWIKKKR